MIAMPVKTGNPSKATDMIENTERNVPGDGRGARKDAAYHHRAPVGEPLDLLALLAPSTPEPN